MAARVKSLKLSEAEFTTQVISYARLRGWLAFHARPARTSKGWRTALQGDAGFPDLVLVRESSLIFAELKVGKNQLTEAQRRWTTRLSNAAYTFVWTPADWPEIEKVLR